MNFKNIDKEFKVIESVYKYAIKQTNESKENMEDILKSINLQQYNFNFDNLKEYREKLYELAVSTVESFERDSILFFAEFLREQYCTNEFPQKMLDHYMSITEAGIIIQKIALNKNCSFRKGANFNRGRLCHLLETLFMYDIIDMKIKYSVNNLYSCDYENLICPLDGEEIELYFKKYDLYFRVQKPEERQVFDTNLKNYLEKRRLTPANIFQDADGTLKVILGFTYSDIDNIVTNIEERIRIFNMKEKCLYGQHHIRINKNKISELFRDLIDKENMDSLLRYLSLNRCIHGNTDTDSRMLELRCITEIDEYLSFGLCNIKECLLILKAISLPGHYAKEIGITKDKNEMFGEFQQKLSNFFSYMVGDFLQHYGYVLPLKESGLIRVELNTIQLSDNKLTFKDIDVLALDPINKRLYNCELKYYKVKMDYQSMLTDALENKKYQNFLKRQAILEENKDEVLLELFGIQDTINYSVCPIVVTSRVNHNTKQVTEYSFEELKKKVLNKEIL